MTFAEQQNVALAFLSKLRHDAFKGRLLQDARERELGDRYEAWLVSTLDSAIVIVEAAEEG